MLKIERTSFKDLKFSHRRCLDKFQQLGFPLFAAFDRFHRIDIDLKCRFLVKLRR